MTSCVDDALDVAEVDHVPRSLVHRPAHRYVERIVVSVPVRVVALPEQPLVLRVGQRGVVNAVRGVELQATRDGDDRHIRKGRHPERSEGSSLLVWKLNQGR